MLANLARAFFRIFQFSFPLLLNFSVFYQRTHKNVHALALHLFHYFGLSQVSFWMRNNNSRICQLFPAADSSQRSLYIAQLHLWCRKKKRRLKCHTTSQKLSFIQGQKLFMNLTFSTRKCPSAAVAQRGILVSSGQMALQYRKCTSPPARGGNSPPRPADTELYRQTKR